MVGEIECLLHTRHFAEGFMCIISFTPQKTPEVGSVSIPILQLR